MTKKEKKHVLPMMGLFALGALTTLPWPLSGLFAALVLGVAFGMMESPELPEKKPQKSRPKSKQTKKVAGVCPFLLPQQAKPEPQIVIASDWRWRKN